MTASPQCIPLAAPRAVLGPCRRAVRRPEGARGAASFAMTDARQPAPGRDVGGGGWDFRMAKRDGKSRRPAGRHLSAVRQPERVDDIDIRNRYNEQVRWEILLLEPVSDWLRPCARTPRSRRTRWRRPWMSWPCAVRSSAGRWLTAFTAARFIT